MPWPGNIVLGGLTNIPRINPNHRPLWPKIDINLLFDCPNYASAPELDMNHLEEGKNEWEKRIVFAVENSSNTSFAFTSFC